jgi:probable rRNA maturation factor
VIAVELENRSGIGIDEAAIVGLCRATLAREGIEEGELGVALVGPNEIRVLKREHLGIDEATDVLSFPIDRRDDLPAGVPRQLGDVVLCPQVVGDAWRVPLVHGLLHLLGYDHGVEMERRERELVSHQGIRAGLSPAITRRQEPPSPLPRHPSLSADECGPWLGAHDRDSRRHYLKGHASTA